MPITALPYTFANNSSALDANTTNANNQALLASASSVDSTQIGPLGIYASQIIPTTIAQATFGGSLGYTFSPGATGQVPLTISAPAGQTANIFQVQLNGVSQFLVGPTGAIGTAGTINGMTLSGNTLQCSGGAQLSLQSATGAVLVNYYGGGVSGLIVGNGASSASGPITCGTMSAKNVVSPTGAQLTVNTAVGNVVFNYNSGVPTPGVAFYNGSAAATFSCDSSGNLIITGTATKPGGGSWTASSDARVKQNIASFVPGLAALLALKPVNYQYNGEGGTVADGKTYVGLIAQDVQPVLPQMVGDDADGFLTLDPSALPYVLINAVQQLAAQVAALQAQVTELHAP
jgi:hypothetical protein